MNCKALVKSSAKFLAAALMTVSAFAQNAVPQFPVVKSPASTVVRDLKHAESIRVRVVLNDLNPGDYVDTLEVSAAAMQSGAGLEVFVDQSKISQVNLTNQVRTYSFAINKANGVDYKQITVRSVGVSRVSKVVARVSDPYGINVGDDPILPEPPPPPPLVGIDPPPPPMFDPNANCSTSSNGFKFSGISEGQVVQICRLSKMNTGAHDGECLANAHCKNPRMTCSTSSNGQAIVGYDQVSTVEKCQAHPSTSDGECASFVRCEGGQTGTDPVPPPNPGNWFNPGLPCQTKSRVLQTGQIQRFSASFIEHVIQMCQDFPGTDKESCRTAAVCQSGGGNTPPPPPPPPPFPGHPGFPGGGHVGPLPPGSNLAGQCQDWNHNQFSTAKAFAYGGHGLDMNDSDATNWAIRYNQTHGCGTIAEFISRFQAIKQFAYSGAGLDLNDSEAEQYALVRAEYVTVSEAQSMQRVLSAVKSFAYDSAGLDLSTSEAASVARRWIDRGTCEDEQTVQQIYARYRTEYNFAYSSGGMNYSRDDAKRYALSRIRHMTRCGDLLN